MTDIRIDNPCPVAISRMTKSNTGYNCKSCKHEVIDFRDKSPDEIKFLLDKGTCGIFYQEDILPSPKRSIKKKFIYYGLSLISFIGFNINVSQAQTPEYKKGDVCPIEEKVDNSVKETKTKHKKYRRGLFRRKKKGRIRRVTAGYFM